MIEEAESKSDVEVVDEHKVELEDMTIEKFEPIPEVSCKAN